MNPGLVPRLDEMTQAEFLAHRRCFLKACFFPRPRDAVMPRFPDGLYGALGDLSR